MQIDRVAEDLISSRDQQQICSLLDICFPDTFEGRSYYKQLPAFRLLAHETGNLAGHVGVVHRVVRLGDEIRCVFGVVDLCIVPEAQGRGLASDILNMLEGIAGNAGVDFIILFADDHRLYKRAGFARQLNTCRWLAIDNVETYGVLEKSLDDCLMVKQIGANAWDGSARLDLLGHLF